MITFEHVHHLWDDARAPDDPVDQLVYRSNLLGADGRLTNYGGGNTSVKVPGRDPVTDAPLRLLWIKGSGGDLGGLTRAGLAVLDLDRVLGLERTYRGGDDEDRLAGLLPRCEAERRDVAPSIDTPLHAVVPHPHVDHVHPDAVIAFAAAEGGERLVEEAFGGAVGWLDWQRPGHDLALRLRDLLARRPLLRGVVLGGHGLISWGDSARACYDTTLELVETAARTIEARRRGAGRQGPVLGERVVADAGPARRRRLAAAAMPVLRGLGSDGRRAVVRFSDDEAVLDLIGRSARHRLVQQGTSCPDHFLRVKQRPLLLDLDAGADPAEHAGRLAEAFDRYRRAYAGYYREHAGPGAPPMRSSAPAVVLWPGVGMFTLARSGREARIAAEFTVNAVNVMRGAETLSSYRGLPDREAFRVEYWALEEAKLRRLPAERPLSRRVALVTGAAGGIGGAIARRLAGEGACVVVADIDVEGAMALAGEIGEEAIGVPLDVADEGSVDAAFEAAALAFGGVDLLVNSAGVGSAGSLADTAVEDYDRLHRIIDRGSFLASRAFARHAAAHGLGGDIVYIVSKNALVAGPGNLAYGSAKAAQLHQMRLVAAELAPAGVRVNAINPDAVIEGSKIFAGRWGDDRAASYGVPRERLGEFYAQRTLLKREIVPDDVAAACFVLVAGELGKTTGAVIPVDGGIPAAFVR
jgi:rhamnulose-1-phosphate aldolase/alcohol dehydrogenase